MAKRKLKLRIPVPNIERAKRALALVAFGAAMEYVDPLPFLKSPFAWVIWFALFLEVFRQFWAYRMEVSYPAVARAEAYKRTWATKRDKIDPNVRYRLRRFITLIVGFYAYGWVVSLFTDRCDGGFQCGLLSIQLAVENMPMFLQIAISIALGLMQMAFMFIALTKVGFVKIVQPGTIDTTFDDVYGQDKAKDRVTEQVDLLENDLKVAKAGGYMPKGVLLTGPPGTGKTMMAKAAANRSTKPLILIPPGAFASTFIGINFLKVWQLGRYIRKYSKRHGGVIVFFDEIDVLGNRGAGVEGGNSEPWFQAQNPECAAFYEPVVDNVIVTGGGGMNMGTLEAFLAMMDGMEEPRGFINKILAVAGFKPLPPPTVRVFYLGATNRPSAVDPALKRAGRFGREIRVDYPDYEGRLHTYNGYLHKVSTQLRTSDIEWFARNHYRGTGAEIQDVINEALLISFRKDGDHQGIVTRDDMMRAVLWKRFGEPQGVFENADNLWTVAVHEAGHAVVLHALKREREHIWFASIEQRGKTGGMVARSPLDDDWMQTRAEMLADVSISLASRIAEGLVFGTTTNGHGGDGPAATTKAERMVALGHTFSISEVEDDGDGTKVVTHGQLSFSDNREAEAFHKERERILVEAYLDAEAILEEHYDALIALAKALEEHHTMIGDDVHALLEEHGV